MALKVQISSINQIDQIKQINRSIDPSNQLKITRIDRSLQTLLHWYAQGGARELPTHLSMYHDLLMLSLRAHGRHIELEHFDQEVGVL